jgi:hypothetical protein
MTATPRDFSQASWRVKLRRAEEHFLEFQAEATRYLDRHPYVIRREHKGKPKANLWRYVLRVTEQPEPRLAAIMGDVLHNARAGMDHVFSAMLPKKRRNSIRAGFPVVRSSIWVDDAGSIHIANGKERENFTSAVQGLGADAVTVLCQLQPGVSQTPECHPLGILSGLENLDKHRDLIPLRFLLRNAASVVTRAGKNLGGQQPDVCEDGTVVTKFGFEPREIPPEDEVRVDVHGAPQVGVNIALKNGRGTGVASELLRILVEDIPRTVFPALEPFVRP